MRHQFDTSSVVDNIDDDTDGILEWLGYDPATRDRLRAEGRVR